MAPSEPPVAAIDLGTNTCLLLIARPGKQGLDPLHQELQVIRLGSGMDLTGRISDEAQLRAVEVVSAYREIIESYHCKIVRCVGTSAVREAVNSADLLERIFTATGYPLSAIDESEEARLILKAVQDAFPPSSGRRWVVDVGGGSTEVIAEKNGALQEVESLELGSVRHTDRWLMTDPPAAGELLALQADILAHLAELFDRPTPDQFIGVGGTATTFVAMEQKLDAYDHRAVHGATLTARSLEKMLDHCLTLTLEKRRALPGLHPGRAEVIIAGGAILLAVLQRSGLPEMQVSDRGLIWGLAAELAAQSGV